MWVNLTTGAITNGSTPNVVGRFATSVGDGWWRIGFADLGNGTIGYMHIYPTDTAGSQNVTANGTDGILIWGGQLNYGSVAQEYIKTTTSAVYGGITDNTPRLDYTDSSCPALLLEPQRTNLIGYSEYFNASGLWLPNTITITDNYGTSPEGLNNSTRLVLGNLTASRIAYAPTLTNGTTYSFSCWYKGTAGEKAYMEGNGSGGSGTQTSKLITFTGDWQREDLQFVGGSSSNLIYIVDSRNGTEDTALDFEVYGAQLEAGSYATSYIPTYGSSVSRVNESSQILNIQSVIGGLEGTIFFDIKTNKTLTSTNYKQFFYYSDSSSAQAYMYISGNNYIVGNPNLGNIVSGQKIQADTRYKIAVTYKANDFKLYINGSLSATRTSGNVIDAVDITSIGSYNGVSEFNEFKFNSYMHFQQVLSNEELAALTTI
jgi:hypothetical protein